MDQTKYQPLYLKHRPQSLGDLVGQKSVVKTLTNAIENKRIAHAYLFTGPRGTGKTSSARILAKSLNCEQGPTVTPCLTCASCVSIKESSCPSVFEIDAASNNSVDDARVLIERAPLVAQGGRNKLYIVDECHMLTKEAFNALLKTIEEPPPNVIFILATTEEHKVPPTILSRCQRLMFRLVNHDELAEHLEQVAQKEGIEIEKSAIELITRRSGGGLRDALGLLDQASLLARPGEPVSQKDLLVLLGALDEDVLLTLSRGILQRDGKAVLEAITGLVMQGREPALIAQELAKHFLNLTKASYVTQQSGGQETNRFVLGSQSYIDGLLDQARYFERSELSQMVEQLDNLEQSLKRASQPSMTLEIALLSLCHRHDIASIKQLENRINQLEEQISQGGEISNRRQAEPSHRPATPLPSRQENSPPPRPAPAAPPSAPAPAAAPMPSPTAAPADTPSTAMDSSESTSAQPETAPLSSPTESQHPQEATEEEGTSAVTATPAPEIRATYSNDEEDYDDESDMDDNADRPSHTPPPTAQPSATIQSPVERLPAPAASVHIPREGTGEMTHGQLEELWSDLLDALHKRSIPAYSLVSMHAFPVRFESKTLTIGVHREFFQKSIENKTNNIIVAYKDLRNDEIRVLVKVVDSGKSESPAKATYNPTAPRGTNEAPPVAQKPPTPEPISSNVALQQDRIEPPTMAHSAPQAQAMPASLTDSRITIYEAEDSNDDSSPSAITTPQPAPKTIERNELEVPKEPTFGNMNIEDTLDSSKIAEAYKIFEGPGSRLIG